MRGSGLGVLDILPVRAGALDSAASVAVWLRSAGAAERNRQIAELSKQQLAHFVSLLDADTGAQLLESLDTDLAAKIVRRADVADAASFLVALEYDDAAAILRQLNNSTRTAILAALDDDDAEALRKMLAWPPGSTAAHMIPDVFTVTAEDTVIEAGAAVRTQSIRVHAKARDEAPIYVLDAERRLIGMVEFQDLVLAEPDQKIAEFMGDDPAWVRPLVDAEEAAHALIDRDLPALPIVDDEHRLLGVLTADAAADILADEATEDAERQGGSMPLEVPYLRASPWLLWRKRIVWLLVLFVAEAYTGTVLRAFEEELDAVVALAFFIPLLIGTGGNTGTQITTTLVRAMATGQAQLRDLPKVLVKEISTGVLVAITMATVGIMRAWTLGVGKEVTITVSLTLAAIVLWSAIAASILPPLLKKMRVDPAVVSAPLISTVVDGTGLIIYFMIAHATLPQLAGL